MNARKPTTQQGAHAQNHARLAALNRQESRDAQNAPKHKSKESVRRQAAAELANERAEMEQEMATVPILAALCGDTKHSSQDGNQLSHKLPK